MLAVGGQFKPVLGGQFAWIFHSAIISPFWVRPGDNSKIKTSRKLFLDAGWDVAGTGIEPVFAP